MAKDFFKNRRKRVISRMLEKESSELKPLAEMEGQERSEFVMILPSASDKLMSTGTYYPFVQDSNFHYLTGFVEADAILLVSTVKGLPFPQHKATLYVSERDELMANEMVTGFRAGTELAKKLTGVDETKDIETFAEDMKQFAKSNFKIWGDVQPGRIGNMSLHSRHIHDGIITAVQNEAEIFPLSPLIQQIRADKTPEEVDIIGKAAGISAEGLLDVMIASRQHRCENYLSSLFEFGCRSRGAEKVFSTSTVVAGGERAIMPHYDQNFGQVEDGALVIASASPRVSGYTARISRTWPNHKKIKVSLDQLWTYMIVTFSQRLFDLGFFKNQKLSREQTFGVIARSLSKQFIGHHIGLDLQDQILENTRDRLRAGHVLNIMPGLHIPADPIFPEKYHNIGVRIEDTVALTKDGAKVLTDLVPREIHEIEGVLGLEI
ncbi:Oidioi.mRNA.OKI2018_I69.PAR.g13199.t1.cds [Oikopleura dioica]|uniref:Oidioi.mRNA.OKI2018_I69.PAR.g13199.t1.cds n=1 Tax=Oikopleura dioica TaxID=34765 RepID=A0ABN7S9S4_OIKDI|nr:Oidioi.mRNA.OKI2018_I69.PAR.g13199.t1.cds [Oikopleura dioica]